jgi:hypothetical protein
MASKKINPYKKAKYKIYRDRKTREKNKSRKLEKLLRTHPNDKILRQAIGKLKKEVHG